MSGNVPITAAEGEEMTPVDSLANLSAGLAGKDVIGGGGAEARKARAMRLPPMCAALRVSLERHLANEEKELWPLFASHFTEAEQDNIIGRIVGRTGAEVLQVMLPFVTNALSVDEKVFCWMFFSAYFCRLYDLYCRLGFLYA